MPYSSLPYPSNNPLQNLKIIGPGVSLSIYVAPNGNDANTGLSSTVPVYSFKQAWTVAQNYVITGNGELYITFAGGTYAYTDADVPDNLYHPQGSSIIIQGDPNAVKQRYLYRVQNYSWDISRISHHGHTGTVNLTNLQAGHTHGFTAADTNQWVAISNPSMSSAGNPSLSYYDPATQVSYYGLDDGSPGAGGLGGRNAIYGDMFFNHGYSYENANGILGLAQIGNASASDTDLQLIFKNTNTDPRIPEFAPYKKGGVDSGVGNSIPYAGIANNYPENQYSKPNGYYGQSSWTGYPAKSSYPTDSYITNQPHLVTSFPVTILKSGGKPVFTVSGGNIKAIRNFMVVANQFATPDVNAPKTKALNALYPAEEHSPQPGAAAWLQALLQVENAKVGIRHLGVYHAEFGVVATNSEVYTYTENDTRATNTSVTNVHTAAGNDVYAKLGHPDNTPVLNLFNVRYGIHAHASKIGIGYESNRQHSASKFYYTEQGCFIQHGYRGIVATHNSSISLRSAVLNSSKSLPRFSFILNVPVFAGSTLTTGNTYSFLSPLSWGGSEYTANSSQAFQNGYTAAAVVMRTSTSGITLGYITNVAGGGTSSYNTGQYGSTHSSGTSVSPLYWQSLAVYGYRVGDLAGLSFSYTNDFTQALQTSTGYTLEFIAFSDNETTRAGGTYEIGNKAYRLSAAGGQFITGVTSTSGLFPLSAYRSNEYHVNDENDATVGVYHGSTLMVRKNIFILNADRIGVYVNAGSRLISGLVRYSSTALGDAYYDESGAILINGAGVYGVLVKNAYAHLGNVFVKNYKPTYKNLSDSSSCDLYTVWASQSTIDFGDPFATVASVFHPHTTTVGLWSTIVGPVCVNTNANSGMLWAEMGSNITIQDNKTNFVSAYDGGTAEQNALKTKLSFITARSGSVMGAFPFGVTTDNSVSATQYAHIWNDNRLNTQIMTRYPGFRYNQSTTSPYYRWWLVNGSRPGGGGRTAGIWTTTGEAVKKVGWTTISGNAFKWTLGANGFPLISCGAGNAAATIGLTYAGTSIPAFGAAAVTDQSDSNNSRWYNAPPQ